MCFKEQSCSNVRASLRRGLDRAGRGSAPGFKVSARTFADANDAHGSHEVLETLVDCEPQHSNACSLS